MGSRILSRICIVVGVIAICAYAYDRFIVEREVVIVSTNDIHAHIDNMPRLATVLQRCRDTVETVYVDAGDRWTGDVYVDKAEGRRPILRLLNRLGCEAATLGNHEFDKGLDFLQSAIDSSSFRVICCNLKSSVDALSDIAPSTVVTLPSGIELFLAGVVTNFCNGHPDGTDEIFEGVTFPDPAQSAHSLAADGKGCSMRILLSHMGDDHDMDYARQYDDYDQIIGGHTHVRVDTVINGTRIVQSGKGLKYCGVTRARFRGYTLRSLTYEMIDLREIPETESIAQMVREIKSDPTFKRKVGSLRHGLDSDGVSNLTMEAIKEGTRSDIAVYHYGGIRISSLPEGDVAYGDICNIDPFSSRVTVFDMTPSELGNVILLKYNDRKNPKESHKIDMTCTVRYKVIVDDNNQAVDVQFPTLENDRRYRIAFCSYIADTYDGFSGMEPTEQCGEVVDMILAYLKKRPEADISGKCLQKIHRR